MLSLQDPLAAASRCPVPQPELYPDGSRIHPYSLFYSHSDTSMEAPVYRYPVMH